MWWTKFEMELNRAYSIVNQAARRIVHDNKLERRKLQQRIKVSWMQTMKDTINARLMEIPMTMTYDQAIRIYCNVVQTKFPNGPQRTNINRRGIAQVGRGQGGGHGNGGNPQRVRRF